MATRVPIPTPSRVVQVVGREQHDRVFKKQDLKGLIDSYCNEPKGHYTVFSIIGAQSSGKSTLMNTMFKTRFQMLNQRTEGRQATTKGIWAAICNDPRAIVLDIEGSDGEEHRNQGTHYEAWNVGVLGPVTLSGLNEGKRDLSNQKWTYQIGLHGESLGVHSVAGSSSVEWGGAAGKQPLTWHKAYFNAPSGNAPVALDMGSMGKGQAWVNGHHIGRYWSYKASGGSCGGCSYTGTYSETKCQTSCGDISQRYYHVPRSWLNPSGNLLVVLEEFGGDLSGVKLVTRTA